MTIYTELFTPSFAAHYVPKPVPIAVIPPPIPNLYQTKMNSNWVFTFNAKRATDAELRLFTVQGQLAGHYSRHLAQAGQGEIKVNASQLKAGMYLWQLHVGTETTKGLVTLSE